MLSLKKRSSIENNDSDSPPIFWSNRDEIVQWEEFVTFCYENSSME